MLPLKEPFSVSAHAQEIRDATGGSASQGIGGSGVVIAGESEVKITGSAKGGDGLYMAGKGVLAGYGSKQDGEGNLMQPEFLTGR